MKTKLLKVLVLSATLFSVGCTSTNTSNPLSSNNLQDTISPIGFEIQSQNNIQELKVDEDLSLSVVVYPENANPNVTWSSSDENVATVNSEGVVHGVSEGRVEITCTSVVDENIKQTIRLQVNAKPVEEIIPESIVLSSKDNITTIMEDETLDLIYEVLPKGASNKVTWSSSDDSIATVNNGVVNAISKGNVTITVTSNVKNDVQSSIDLTVTEKPTLSWEEIDYSSYDEFLELEKEDAVKIKGVIAHITTPNDGKVNVYVLNGNTGYYIYDISNAKYDLEVGASYEIGGYKNTYRGLNEIVDVEIFNKINETITYTITDVSNLNVKDKEAMLPYQNSYITANAKISELPSKTTKAFSIGISIGENTIDLRVDPQIVGEEDFNSIVKNVETSIEGNDLKFNGIMSSFGYSNSYYFNQITILKANDLTFAEASDELIVNKASEKINVPAIIDLDTNSIDLVSSIDEVNVKWTSSDTSIITNEGQVTHPSVDTNVTLTAELTLNDAKVTKNFVTLVYGENSNYTEVALLDLEDALESDKNGTSTSTPEGYKGAELTLNNISWKLQNALIGSLEGDKRNGNFSIRAKSGSSKAETGRIELKQDLEINAVEFNAAIYGNDSSIKLSIEYSIDSGENWIETSVELTLTNYSLQKYRILLPETADRIAIYVVENSGNRVSVDDIKLLK